jgi:hypothetical protein
MRRNSNAQPYGKLFTPNMIDLNVYSKNPYITVKLTKMFYNLSEL